MHVVIVGAYGSAGAAAAERLADHVGDAVDRLTLVDDGDPGGGLCILRGCMPSKEVISAAAHRYQARSDGRLDGRPGELDLDSVVATKDQHVGNFARHRRAHIDGLADREGVEFVAGTARFVDDHTVAVHEGTETKTGTPLPHPADAEPDRTIDADRVVVATGSVVNVPDLPGLADREHRHDPPAGEVGYRTSADVLDATDLPDSGIVMGFGFVGMELAPYLAEAGVDVTVIEHDERPLDEATDAFGDELMEIYREEFDVDVLTGTRERELEPTRRGGVRLTCEGPAGTERTVTADELFLFTGRRPNLDGLNLDAAGIDPGRGFVRDTMQAADADHVYLPGDVNGEEPVLHIAKEQGYLTADNVVADAAGDDLAEFSYTTHHVVFSGAGVYPYARVGHTGDSAEAIPDVDPIVVTRRAEDDGVFKTKDAARGLAELVVDADGTVVGYQGLHYHADVMAKTMQLAVEMELDVRDVPDRAYHPTTPEILDGLLRDAVDRLDD